jgi:hypothetical protein
MTNRKGILNQLLGFFAQRDEQSEREAPYPKPEVQDQLKNSSLYRLKRDSLLIVAKMNKASDPMSLESFKRQIVFVQSQLVLAAIRDPSIPVETKGALVSFQEASLRETIEDRRSIKRRGCVEVGKHAANQPIT